MIMKPGAKGGWILVSGTGKCTHPGGVPAAMRLRV
jgi:hypothetical protein